MEQEKQKSTEQVDLSGQSSQGTDFLRETIKQKPINKKKLLRRTMITVLMAIVFGLVASLTILVLQPIISNWINPKQEAQTVYFPEETDEVSPEDMYVDDSEMVKDAIEQENPVSESTTQFNTYQTTRMLQSMLDGITYDETVMSDLYSSLQKLAYETENAIVSVEDRVDDSDLSEGYQEPEKMTGLIVASTGRELVILLKEIGLDRMENLVVTFRNGSRSTAQFKGQDLSVGITILTVPLYNVSETTMDIIRIATLGSSNNSASRGIPVIAVGDFMGTGENCISYGTIVSDMTHLNLVDSDYKLITTDIAGVKSGSGVLISLEGKILGIIDGQYNSQELPNLISAVGITELKPLVEKLSNGDSRAYLGIHGMDITSQRRAELGIPDGVYISSVEFDSPAMQAGIQSGDVLTTIDEEEISSYREVINKLRLAEPGTEMNLTVSRQTASGYVPVGLVVTLSEAQ